MGDVRTRMSAYLGLRPPAVASEVSQRGRVVAAVFALVVAGLISALFALLQSGGRGWDVVVIVMAAAGLLLGAFAMLASLRRH
jgi:hypothetical protein